jgi:hypothetical protein
VSWAQDCGKALTVLTAVLAAHDGQAFADCRAHHKGVGRAEAVLVRLRQLELLEVESELAHVGQLLDGHLTRVGVVLVLGILTVHEEGLVLRGLAIARELEGTTGGESVGAPTDHLSLSVQAFVLRERERKRVRGGGKRGQG